MTITTSFDSKPIETYTACEEFCVRDNNHPGMKKKFTITQFPIASFMDKARRVCIRSTREVGELLFSHAFIVTNLF